jgi:hypothetical protein
LGLMLIAAGSWRLSVQEIASRSWGETSKFLPASSKQKSSVPAWQEDTKTNINSRSKRDRNFIFYEVVLSITYNAVGFGGAFRRSDRPSGVALVLENIVVEFISYVENDTDKKDPKQQKQRQLGVTAK